jgi:hypothetical protein
VTTFVRINGVLKPIPQRDAAIIASGSFELSPRATSQPGGRRDRTARKRQRQARKRQRSALGK